MFLLKKKASKEGGAAVAIKRGIVLLGYFGVLRAAYFVWSQYAPNEITA